MTGALGVRAAVVSPLLVLAGTAAPAAAEVTVTDQARTLNAWFLTQAPEPPSAVRVCMLDRGTDPTPDTASVDRRWVWGDGPLGDLSPVGHGTAVAQLVGAPTNAWGIVGIAPQVGVLSIGVGAEGDAGWAALSRGVWACAQDPAVRVISISANPPASTVAEVDQFAGQVALARDRGISVVAAAGNEGAAPTGPATVAGVIAIGGAQPGAGALCVFSNRAAGMLVAQGCAVEATTTTGALVRLDGTSFAAPQVAAALAALRAHRPDLGRDAAEALLAGSARPGPEGTRVVDASAMFTAAGLSRLLREPPAPVAALSRLTAPMARVTASGRSAVRVSVPGVAATRRVVWRGAGVRRLTRATLLAVRGARARTIRIAVTGGGLAPTAWRTIRIPAAGAAR